ncbi:MAG: methyltransferase domain-containing protein [Oscillospiraceae bacterium]|nr:methyltransferase domain-containing protein [Oscillospiraceae bacterium]
MFWDAVAGVYDLFGNIYNRKADRELCDLVASQIGEMDRVLECACGTGMISLAIAPRCAELIATDFSDGMLSRAAKKLAPYRNTQVCKADIMDLAYPDGSFDCVVAANVIHLLDEPYKALRELDRVCRSGGKLLIPTYVNNEKTGKTGSFAKTVGKAGADFKRQFTFSNYRAFFQEAGYSHVETVNIQGRVPCAAAIITKP